MPPSFFPQVRVPLILDSDASHSRLGAVLSQVQSGRERVIAYAARSPSKAERNYNTLRNELLALEWATENFETFLYGQHFLARTDHSALPWVKNLKNSRSQVARLLERLSDFDFEVENSPGQLHGDGDGLSRLPFDEDASVRDRRDATLIQSKIMEQSRDSLRATQNQDPALSQAFKWLKTGVRPPGGDVDGVGRGGRKLLLYWSQWGKRAKTSILI